MPLSPLDVLSAVACAWVVAFGVALTLVLTHDAHIRWSGDHPGTGPQKLHTDATPRIGGLAVVLGMAAGVVLLPDPLPGARSLSLGTLLLCGLPVALLGLAEDLTKKVDVPWRLATGFASAALAWWLCDARLLTLGLGPVDQWLMAYPSVAVVVTLVAVGGVTHAMNIVDGLNGLLGGLGLLALGALAYVAHAQGDLPLYGWALCLMAALLGFLVFNFPRARLFSGDGGAYFVGFGVATTAVLLVRRHPDISPWFPMALVIHPVTETLYSSVRRWLQRRSATGADAQHFHYQVMAWLRRRGGAMQDKRVANPAAAVLCVLLAALPVLVALAHARTPWVLQLTCLAYVLLYLALTRWLSRAAPGKGPREGGTIRT